VLDLTPEQRKEYRKVEREYVCGEQETQWAVVLHTWLSRLSGGFRPGDAVGGDPTVGGNVFHTHKTNELLSLLHGELHGEKVVVWCRFNQEIDHLHDVLNVDGVNVRKINGQTPVSQREEIQKYFNTTDYIQVVLCQIKGGLKGVSLWGADTAIYYSTGWSMEDRYQSEDRTIHPSKTTPQLIIDLVMRDTVDEDVVYALLDKSCTADEFLRRMRISAERRMQKW
jgi:SNF2 family DNA or RNA helicase